MAKQPNTDPPPKADRPNPEWNGDWQTYALVRGVILNACGRAAFLNKEAGRAREILGEVISTVPDFVDAYINFADACLPTDDDPPGGRGAVTEGSGDNRPDRALAMLQRAVEISPANQRAHLLMARAYWWRNNPTPKMEPGKTQEKSKSDLDLASEELDQAGTRPAVDVLRAIILKSDDKWGEALKTLKKSIETFSKPDDRILRYARMILDPNSKVTPSAEQLAEAKGLLERLNREGGRSKDRDDAKKMLDNWPETSAKTDSAATGANSNPPPTAPPTTPPVGLSVDSPAGGAGADKAANDPNQPGSNKSDEKK